MSDEAVQDAAEGPIESMTAAGTTLLVKPEAPDEAVIAAGPLDDITGLPTQWHGVLSVEGLRTTDHRMISPGGLSWRQLPLAICAQFEDIHGYGDTPASPIVGSITNIERDETTGWIMGEGTFDLTTEPGIQAARMCLNQTLRWNSVDLEIITSQDVVVSTDQGYPDPAMDIIDILFDDDVNEDGCTDWYTEITEARIMKTTMVSTPAFPQCVMAPIDVPLDVPEPMSTAPQVNQGLLASALTIPDEPPSSWFANPELAEPTPMEITDDGRVFGHLALWKTNHIGFDNVNINPPRSQKDYAYFTTGKIKCADGEQVQVGQITFNTGHADTYLKASDTTHHYDHTGYVAADIAVGEDEHGIWFAGALRPGLNAADIRAVRAAPLSGDWRQIGNGLELVAALAVNVPGFPIVAAGRRRGEQVSLIAGGVKRRNPMEEMAREIATLRRAIAPLMGQSIEQLRTRVNGKPVDLALVASLKERVSKAS